MPKQKNTSVGIIVMITRVRRFVLASLAAVTPIASSLPAAAGDLYVASGANLSHCFIARAGRAEPCIAIGAEITDTSIVYRFGFPDRSYISLVAPFNQIQMYNNDRDIDANIVSMTAIDAAGQRATIAGQGNCQDVTRYSLTCEYVNDRTGETIRLWGGWRDRPLVAN